MGFKRWNGESKGVDDLPFSLDGHLQLLLGLIDQRGVRPDAAEIGGARIRVVGIEVICFANGQGNLQMDAFPSSSGAVKVVCLPINERISGVNSNSVTIASSR
jgi:hypothetical protein